MLMEVEGRQGIAQLFDTRRCPTKSDSSPSRQTVARSLRWQSIPRPRFLSTSRCSTTCVAQALLCASSARLTSRPPSLPGSRCIADRQGDRGCQARRAGGQADVRRDRDGRSANGSNHAIPQRDERSWGLAKVGPIKSQSDSVMGVISSPRTAVHLVTLLEEMPVQETLDGIEELRDNNLPVGAVIVNMERGPRLTPEGLREALDGTLDVDEVRAGVEAAELPRKLNVNTVTKVLMTEAAEHAERVQLEQTERDRLNAAERPIYELPEMNGGIDLGALYAMARMLREQGLRDGWTYAARRTLRVNASARHRRTHRRPRGEGHRLLRLRRCRKDDNSGVARTSRG